MLWILISSHQSSNLNYHMITSNLFSQPGGMPTQSRSFSKNSKEGRGDTSVWTDNPLDRAQKAKMKYDYCLLVIVNIHLF
jgi:hypothetical protein